MKNGPGRSRTISVIPFRETRGQKHGDGSFVSVPLFHSERREDMKMGYHMEEIQAMQKCYPVIKRLVIAALLLALTMTMTACGGGAGKAAIEDMAARLIEATDLYDEGDYLSAAQLVQTQRETFAALGLKLSYKTAKAYRDTVLLPLYDWLDSKDDNSKLIGKPANKGYIIDIENEDETKDTKASRILYGMESALKLLWLNSMYQYYRQADADGKDIYTLEDYPYFHDRDWGDFSKNMYRAYQLNVEAPEEYLGGTKLLIVDSVPNSNDKWITMLLESISPVDLATESSEVGCILYIDRDSEQRSKVILKSTGAEVGGSYQRVVTLSMTELATGDTREINTYRKSPTVAESAIRGSGAGNLYGEFTAENVSKALQQDIIPALKKYAHFFLKVG